MWDIIVIIFSWGPGSLQWLLHAVVSISSVCTPFVYPSTTPMSFYAICLLLFELSTPLFSLRYYLFKAGAADSFSGLCMHAAFVLSFFFVRIIYGCCFLFPEIWVELSIHPTISQISTARKFIYRLSMLLFALLQLLWLLQLLCSSKGTTSSSKTCSSSKRCSNKPQTNTKQDHKAANSLPEGT